MDINSYLQAFELSVLSYAGDDPLDPWDKFLQFLESRLSVEERKSLSVEERKSLSVEERKSLSVEERKSLSVEERKSLSVEERKSLSVEERKSLSVEERKSLSVEERKSLSVEERKSLSVEERKSLSVEERKSLSVEERKSLSVEERKSLSVVLERIVQTFLPEQRYHNDPRYVALCLRWAGLFSDPMEVYVHLHGRGVGTQAAALYVDWALQLEKRGQLSQAENVYQRALENKAQPQECVMQQYRLFQGRMNALTAASDHVRQPLQSSQLINQNHKQREAVQPQCKDPEASPGPRMVRIISRSENNPVRPAGGSAVECVSMYCVKDLQCEGSELSFEELRARRYFSKRRQQEEQRRLAQEQRRLWEEEEEVRKMKQLLLDLEENATLSPHTHPLTRVDPPEPVWSSRPQTGQQLHTEPAAEHAGTESVRPLAQFPCGERLGQTERLSSSLTQSEPESRELVVCDQADGDADGKTADTSCGAFNHSHVTPNTSLGFAHATPSRVLPSPTVNTREALGVIMDMFQAPTLLQESMFNSIIQPEDSFERSCRISSAPSCANAPSTAAFMIYQDRDEQEDGSDQVRSRPAARALTEIPVSRASDPALSTLASLTDESTMWGARNVSVGPCPNHTRDFALSAHLVSTPLHPHAPHCWDTGPGPGPEGNAVSGPEENPYTRQPTKLSPILEQSPLDEKPSEPAESSLRAQGTIVGEGVSMAPSAQGPSLALSCSRLPLAALSFPDHTGLRTQDESLSRPCWSVYQSPEREPEGPLESSHRPSEPLEEPDVLMSPRAAPGLHWLQEDSTAQATEPDLDVMMSPAPGSAAPRPAWTIYQSPERGPQTDLLWAMSPAPEPAPEQEQDLEDLELLLPEQSFQQRGSGQRALQALHESLLMSPRAAPAQEPRSPGRSGPPLEVMASPAQRSRSPSGPMSPMDTSAACVRLVSDPWDAELIVSLLSNLQPPLSSHPNLTVWSCRLPAITPKMTVQIAGESLRVDFVLGQGAFATVYQATNLMSTQKLFLKVQKPANPWEFYIDGQLNARLPPSVRHLFSSIYSGHLFSNGSVLVGELHNCGTLLNAINLYKGRGEKLMPQPLVLYFTSVILHMVEQLHHASIIHADIKPDNFLLGERFLENDCFEPGHLGHGLALIDLGQSIDMTLFPEGTAFTAKCMTSGFQCVEMLSGRPWSYQTDYFGIAGTVYCMLFGTYMQVKQEGGVWRTSGVFKRNVHAELWLDLFHDLLNVPVCGSGPSLSSLRRRVDAVLSESYSGKLRGLKNRLVVQILEARSSRR